MHEIAKQTDILRRKSNAPEGLERGVLGQGSRLPAAHRQGEKAREEEQTTAGEAQAR